jgi:hypothetical protein
MWLANILYQTATVTGGGNPPPHTVDPGNDPIVSLLATVAFVIISIGGGVFVTKLRLRRLGYDAKLLQPTIIKQYVNKPESKKEK